MTEIAQKILELIGSFAGLIFGSEEFKKIKILISLISLIISILFISYYIYLEKKYKIGSSILLINIKNFLEAFIKKEYFHQEWEKIKDVFLVDYFIALNKVYNYLQNLINFYDYEGENLIEKYSKFPDSVFENKQNFLKALKVLEIIKNKKENIKISKKESLALIRIIEKGLTELLVIDSQAQWAIFLTLPEE